MGFSASQPAYLYQTPSGYIFRLRVPGDLKELVGRCEFRYSLRAGALRVAKYRARLLASYVQQLFSRIRNSMNGLTPERITEMVKEYIRKELEDDKACDGQTAMSTPGSIIIGGEYVLEASSMKGSNGITMLSPERITQLVNDYVWETLTNDEKCRAIGGTISTEPVTLSGKSILEGSNMGADEAKSLLKSVTRWLQLPDHSVMHTVTEKILSAQDVDIDPLSETYKVMSRELLKAFQSVLQVRIRRSEGDYSVSDEDLIPSLKQPLPATHTRQPTKAVEDIPIIKFTDVQKRYFEEMVRGGSWTEKTEDTRRAILELFVLIMGDMDISKIDRKSVFEFKATLMKLPPNMNKSPIYRDKSIKEIIDLKPAKTLSVHSLNKYTITLSGLFNYAVKNGFMVSNPATDMQIRNPKRADQERQPYTTEDLQKLFNSSEYQKENNSKPYTYWPPMIALFTGCRLNEICQLHLDDIRQEKGVWIFDINSKKEKHLKNISSERFIPIHPKLIESGLFTHVDALKAKGATRLFPELRLRRDGYGQTVSKWFQRFKERCGIDEQKNFHSFRHTFITNLKHKQVNPDIIKELAGHSIEGETMNRYGKRFPPEILLREAIEKIDYGIGLSRL